MSRSLQAPPLPSRASHTGTSGPPARSSRLSIPSVKNATASLRGDQNGYDAPCDPGTATASPLARVSR
ncbi:MAG: hypothetical protein R3D98_04290 [Candidatus Krumholzibacteriia bacterium]